MNNKIRDNYFDNLRGFLIICVIVGNSLEYISPSSVNPHYLILFLYMFHMPLFTFISGYFCKKSKRSTVEKVIDTTKIYLFVQTFYFIFNRYILDRTSVKFQLLYPSWTLWYLMALIIWYVLSDYIKNYKIAFALSVAASLIIGFDGSIGTYASVSRIFFFMPFFIAGMAFNKETFLEKYKKYSIHLGVLTCIILIILFAIREFTDVEYFFEYTNYTFYSDSAIYPFILRLFHYIGGFIICSFILMVFTHKKTLFTWFGKNSLVLYISHAAVIQLLTLRPILKYGSWSQLILSEAFIVTVLLVLAMIIKKITSYAKSIQIHDINDLNQQA
ncbi:acyltransferase family protein [Clostridium butyricum]